MPDYQVPRLAFAWLLFTQTFLLLPHLVRFPLILIPVWLVSTFWRIMIYRGRWTYPSAWIKTLLVVVSCIALIIVQKRWMTVETAILALLVSFLLKLLEMKQLRDVLMSIYLAYFVIATELLLSQSIIAGFYLLSGLLMVTATLIAMQSSSEDEVPWSYPLSQSLKMLVLSLPVMVAAFLVFPRLEPLWTVPMPAGAGKTGVSGSMSPGLYAQLAQSDELAFRVKFEGDVPPLQALYWRGVVLTRFDGKTWLPADEPELKAPPLDDIAYTSSTVRYDYRVTMEPSYQQWLFPLETLVQTTADALYFADFTVKSRELVDHRQSWSFSSNSHAVLNQVHPAGQQQLLLDLPEGYNPATLEFARKLFSSSASADGYIEKVLDHFRQEEFFYTLNPPLLGKNSVDDFLFKSRRGFCEHYASAFVVLMRAAGIPARIIGGYQGGDINPYEKHVTVRQLDAHAWAEVWLEGKGWLRIDPTYVIAPERIEMGGRQSLQSDEKFLAQAPFSPMRYPAFSWLRKMQYRFDQVNYRWHSLVLNYSGNQQQSLLLSLLGSTSPRTLALFLASVFLALGLALAGFFALRYRLLPLSAAEKTYRRLLKKMARKGLQKQPGEGAMDFACKAKLRWPRSAAAIDHVIQQYLVLNYAELPDKARVSYLLKQFKRDVIRLELKE